MISARSWSSSGKDGGGVRARRRGLPGARAGGRAARPQPVLRLHQRRAHVLLRSHTQALQVYSIPTGSRHNNYNPHR